MFLGPIIAKTGMPKKKSPETGRKINSKVFGNRQGELADTLVRR